MQPSQSKLKSNGHYCNHLWNRLTELQPGQNTSGKQKLWDGLTGLQAPVLGPINSLFFFFWKQPFLACSTFGTVNLETWPSGLIIIHQHKFWGGVCSVYCILKIFVNLAGGEMAGNRNEWWESINFHRFFLTIPPFFTERGSIQADQLSDKRKQ